MKYLLILFFIGILFAQELQVDGNLTVTGNIQSVTIDSLQNEVNILNGKVDSLFTLLNSIRPLRLIDHQLDLITPESGQTEVVIFDTTYSPFTFEEFVRVELNTWTNFMTGYYNTGVYLTAYFGTSGSEVNQGTLIVESDGTGGEQGYNYTPQLWWNIITDPQIIDQPLRLYIIISNGNDHRGGISKLFIWGR